MDTVVIVTPGFPADEQDTTCLPPVQQLVLSLRKNFSEIKFTIVSLHYPFVQKQYLWNNIPIVAIGGRNRRLIWKWLAWRRTYQVLEHIRKTENLKGMITFWCTDAARVSQRFALDKNLSHFIWLQGQDAKKNNRHIAYIKPKASQLVALSDFLQEEFFKNHRVKPAHVIENGINAEIFPPYNNGTRPIDVLGAGSLIPLKNYRLFIELIAELKKIKPDITAVIAGKGKEHKRLQHLINKLNLEENVKLVGLKSHRETLELMSQSKVFLHTAHYEGGPMVLAEALYSGCIGISTRALSNRQIENLFVGKSKEELLKKLVQLFSQKEIQHKQIVFNTADTSAKKIMELLFKELPEQPD